MTQLKNMKFRVKAGKQQEALENVLYSLGYKWSVGESNRMRDKAAFRYAYEDGDLTWDTSEEYFDAHDNELQDTAAFIAQHTERGSSEHTTPNKEKEEKNVGRKHKFAEEIHKWADGVEIELQTYVGGPWSLAKFPTWNKDWNYRIKPARIFPKSSLTRQELLAIVQATPGDFMDSYVAMADKAVERYILDSEKVQ